jgi:VIT1/CCC1 family predicted Fe2+/Mn2+ transporter
MAVGEYISVSSQRDTELADIDKEKEAQRTRSSRLEELEELAQIYVDRGLDYPLARQVGPSCVWGVCVL